MKSCNILQCLFDIRHNLIPLLSLSLSLSLLSYSNNLSSCSVFPYKYLLHFKIFCLSYEYILHLKLSLSLFQSHIHKTTLKIYYCQICQTAEFVKNQYTTRLLSISSRIWQFEQDIKCCLNLFSSCIRSMLLLVERYHKPFSCRYT